MGKRLVSSWKDLYPSLTELDISSTAPLPNVVDVVDLRQEFDNLVLGQSGEIPIGRSFILRRMRRDASDNMIACSCTNHLTQEPDRDFPCPYCYGAGFLFDEELVTAYAIVISSSDNSNAAINFRKTQFGTLYSPSTRFLLSYSINPRKEDRIVELGLDSNGNPIIPYNRIAIFELMLVRAMRADNGKIEYWICDSQKMGPDTQGWVS